MAKELEIDLGSDMGLGQCCSQAPSPESKYYPSARLELDRKVDFPESGYVTFRYKKTESSERHNPKFGMQYSCTLELHELCELESDGKEPEEKEEKAGDALDRLASEKMKSKEGEDYEEED